MKENFTFGKRPANLHESDPYWDSDDMIWRRKDGTYDDEANDTRPDEEKYSNYPLVVIAMLLVLLGLGFGLMWIMDRIA